MCNNIACRNSLPPAFLRSFRLIFDFVLLGRLFIICYVHDMFNVCLCVLGVCVRNDADDEDDDDRRPRMRSICEMYIRMSMLRMELCCVALAHVRRVRVGVYVFSVRARAVQDKTNDRDRDVLTFGASCILNWKH